MSVFSQLKQQFIAKLATVLPNSGLVELHCELPIAQDVDVDVEQTLLAWLKAQQHYPQAFWQQREGGVAFAALGCVQACTQLDDLHRFQLRYPTLPLVGGIQFEGECRFVLPRLQITKNGSKLTACFYLDSHNFAQEMAISHQFLAELVQFAPLESRDNACLSVARAAEFPQWQERVERAVGQIRQGELQKVVLANATTLTFAQPVCGYELLARSRRQNQGCYHFLWAESEEAMFVGSSPEQLYARTQYSLSTEALAGTVAVSDNARETEQNRQWLLNDEKNIHENQLVVDDIQHHLADCVTGFAVEVLEIKALKNVQHLRRRIHATLKPQVSDADCLARIHPTAAVAGLPRLPAKQFITTQESFKRGWYAGTLGACRGGQAEFCVTLRSALISRHCVTLYAGAGIVAASDAAAEWQEIERKALAMKQLLSLKSNEVGR